MSLSSFNSFLLAKLVKNFRLGTDPRSLMRRHQTLSIVYVNCSLFIIASCYDAISVMFGIEYHHIPDVMFPFIIGSFVALRKGKNETAAIIVLLYAHGINLYVSNCLHSSLGALVAVLMFPNYAFFISSSSTVQIANMIMCILQIIGHIINAMKVFVVTMNTDQTNEINLLFAVVIPCVIFLCFGLMAQKSVENNIWQAACTTHERTEKINHEILQAVEAKDAFISSLSHEIRNPLNAMSGSINYLLKVIKDPQSQQVLQNARISGETLLNLFNNLLDAAKMKSDKMELSYDDTNLYETLKKALVINCENIRNKRMFVEVLLDRNVPQIIRSDSARLLQILMNLMSNSIKFTPEEGKINIYATFCNKGEPKEQLEAPINLNTADLDISSTLLNESAESSSSSQLADDESSFFEEYTSEEAKTRSENLNKSIRIFRSKTLCQMDNARKQSGCQNQPWSIKRVSMNSSGKKSEQDSPILDSERSEEDRQDYFLKIQITDTGCGIAQENIPKLFEMFNQAHRNITSTHGGTGLGLWICKQLCQKMGGDIKLYSELGKGTSFVFYIPVTHQEGRQILPCEQDISQPRRNDKVSCMVVDDFSYNRDLYKLLLEREGVQVITASDGEEAIKKYLSNIGKLDFILMDVQMPKIDGFTAAKKIREMEALNKWRRVDIYFVSGEYYNEEEVMASFRTQARDGEALGIQSLKKPIDIEVISKVAAKYTKQGRCCKVYIC